MPYNGSDWDLTGNSSGRRNWLWIRYIFILFYCNLMWLIFFITYSSFIYHHECFSFMTIWLIRMEYSLYSMWFCCCHLFKWTSWSLGAYWAGLNCGRWDYIFSVLQLQANNPNVRYYECIRTIWIFIHMFLFMC
jgi:hypothetical protein